MKKLIRLILCSLFTACCLTQICSAANISESNKEDPITKDARILSSYNISMNSACAHSYTRVDLGDIIGESCTNVTRNYKVWCHNCRQYITGGTIVIPKDTPEHTMRWYTVSCIRGKHTYERRYTKCGYATESFTRACSGPPCPEIMSLFPHHLNNDMEIRRDIL